MTEDCNSYTGRYTKNRNTKYMKHSINKIFKGCLHTQDNFAPFVLLYFLHWTELGQILLDRDFIVFFLLFYWGGPQWLFWLPLIFDFLHSRKYELFQSLHAPQLFILTSFWLFATSLLLADICNLESSLANKFGSIMCCITKWLTLTHKVQTKSFDKTLKIKLMSSIKAHIRKT